MTRPDRNVASFAHLGKGLAADDSVSPLQDADEANGQEPTTPCDMCEGSGTFGGDECPACDGEGEVTASQVQEKSDLITDAANRIAGQSGQQAARKLPAGMAKAIAVAEGRATAKPPAKPKAGTQAAAIVAAYDRAERKPPRGGR